MITTEIENALVPVYNQGNIVITLMKICRSDKCNEMSQIFRELKY